MKSVIIEGQVRATIGSKSAKDLRREGQIPCVIYGPDGNINFSAPVNAFKELFYSPELSTATIKVDGKEVKCITKEAQWHPVNDSLMHVDFQQMVPGDRVITEIPIRSIGRSIGVSNGGKLVAKVRKIKVKLLPKELVEFLEVDVTPLKMGKSMRVADLAAKYSGMEFLLSDGIPVFSVEVPRTMRGTELEEGEEEGTEEGAETPAETPAEA